MMPGLRMGFSPSFFNQDKLTLLWKVNFCLCHLTFSLPSQIWWYEEGLSLKGKKCEFYLGQSKEFCYHNIYCCLKVVWYHPWYQKALSLRLAAAVKKTKREFYLWSGELLRCQPWWRIIKSTKRSSRHLGRYLYK